MTHSTQNQDSGQVINVTTAILKINEPWAVGNEQYYLPKFTKVLTISMSYIIQIKAQLQQNSAL